MKATYGIASDLSEVVLTPDGFGKFTTELAAAERIVELLEIRQRETKHLLGKARRRLVYQQRLEEMSLPSTSGRLTTGAS